GRDHDVLQPQPEAPGQVDARLHAERVPGHERRGVAGHDVRVFVGLGADAVTGAVHEVVAVASVGDDVARRRVDVFAPGTDGGRADTGLLRLDQHRIRVADFRVGLADDEHARDVGAVPAHRAAEVAQHDIARRDDARARVVVRAGRVLAGGDDGEVGPLVPALEHALDELAVHAELGAPRKGTLA